MNKHIQELVEQATIRGEEYLPGDDGHPTPTEYFDKEKFALLLIQKCSLIASMFSINKNDIHPDIKWVNMTESAKMVNHTTCQQVAEKIRENFGVEE